MNRDQSTSEDSAAGYATMGRGPLRYEARSVTGDVAIGGIDEGNYQLLTLYLSPEQARELVQQLTDASEEAALYRLGGESK